MFCLSFIRSWKDRKRKRGKWRIGERPAKSLDIEIGGRFPLILNKEHKVVLFPPGFQTVQDPPGVKHDPPSLSLFLFIFCPLRLFVPFLRCWRLVSLLIILSLSLSLSLSLFLSLSHFHSLFFTQFWLREQWQSRPVYWCYKFNFSLAQIIVHRKGGDYILERESSLSFAIVRVTAREAIKIFTTFFHIYISLSLSLFLYLSLWRKSSWVCTHASNLQS